MAMLQQVESVSIAGLGQLPLADNDAEFQPSQKERELVEGMKAGDGGFIRKSNVGAKLKMTVLHRQGFDLQDFNALDSALVTVRYSNGETHVMPEAACDKAIDSGKDGKLKIEMESAESRKLSSN